MKNSAIIVCLLMVLCLSGCYRPDDVNSLGYLMAIGIDNGENDNFLYTLQFANPIVFVGKDAGLGNESDNSSLKTITVNAKSMFQAFTLAESEILKKIDTSYLKLVIFSNMYNNGNIKNDIETMQKSPLINSGVYIAFSECLANEYLENVNSPLEINPARYYDNIFNADYNQYSPEMRLKHASGEFGVFPLVDKSVNSYGVAIVDNGRIVYKDNKNSGILYNIVSGNIDGFNFELKDLNVVLKLNKISNPSIKTKIGSTADIFYSCGFDGEVFKNPENIDIKIIEKAAKKQIETEMLTLINKYYGVYDCDVFGYKNRFKQKFLTINAWNRFDKITKPSDLKCSIKIDLNIEREGITIK